jgi:hypothetical protein
LVTFSVGFLPIRLKLTCAIDIIRHGSMVPGSKFIGEPEAKINPQGSGEIHVLFKKSPLHKIKIRI